jgi:hypothetical protein
MNYFDKEFKDLCQIVKNYTDKDITHNPRGIISGDDISFCRTCGSPYDQIYNNEIKYYLPNQIDINVDNFINNHFTLYAYRINKNPARYNLYNYIFEISPIYEDNYGIYVILKPDRNNFLSII